MARIFSMRIFNNSNVKNRTCCFLNQTSLAAIFLLSTLVVQSVLILILVLVLPQPAQAVETWEKLDKRMKGQVVQLSVGLKMKIKTD